MFNLYKEDSKEKAVNTSGVIYVHTHTQLSS
jgi:hypothetical protein